jgi:hypothetical protein|tara:strand:+ start:1156 stop:1998 length:843 start_codon:yes stop_codon:yes gene_type:complete
MKLTKFSSFTDNSLVNLNDSSLWFSRLEDYNDPFEGKIKIKDSYVASPFESKEEAKLLYDEFVAYIKNIKTRNIESDLDFLNEQPELQNKINKMFSFFYRFFSSISSDLIHGNGYCCFCDEYENAIYNKLMWSHYADGLRGFSLVFDKEELHNSLIELNDEDALVIEPIEYIDTIPELDLYHQIKNTLIESESAEHIISDFWLSCRLTKSSAWGYEKELRAISSHNGKYNFSPESLKEIILGEKMSKEKRELIISIAKVKYPHASLHIMKVCEEKYQLVG